MLSLSLAVAAFCGLRRLVLNSERSPVRALSWPRNNSRHGRDFVFVQSVEGGDEVAEFVGDAPDGLVSPFVGFAVVAAMLNAGGVLGDFAVGLVIAPSAQYSGFSPEGDSEAADLGFVVGPIIVHGCHFSAPKRGILCRAEFLFSLLWERNSASSSRFGLDWADVLPLHWS